MKEEAIHSKLNRNEIVQELEEAAKAYFGCNLTEYIQKSELGKLPADKEVLIGTMRSWLELLPKDDNLFQEAHNKLSSRVA